ncbi:hypothetical protein AB6D40_022640 [Vibrio cyclitrophicus]
MRLIVKRSVITRIMLVMLSLMVAGCASPTSHSVSWPTNLNVITLIDGGVCLDKDSAIRLAELRAQLEAM